MATAPSSDTAYLQVQRSKPHRKRSIRRDIERGLKRFDIEPVTLMLLGAAQQAIATELDKRNDWPRGQCCTIEAAQTSQPLASR